MDINDDTKGGGSVRNMLELVNMVLSNSLFI
jgi:hypothetical protein